MNRITLENYRCFRNAQSARLAPLTLLVGDNSTGKTSFLAMIRVLWDTIAEFKMPEFKEDPYDLGSFDEIAHYRGSRGGRSSTFKAGFEKTISIDKDGSTEILINRFEAAFTRLGTIPVPTKRRLQIADNWIEDSFDPGQSYEVEVGTSRGSWKPPTRIGSEDIRTKLFFIPFFSILQQVSMEAAYSKESFDALRGSDEIEQDDKNKIEELYDNSPWLHEPRPFASAPVRSKPSRTYDPSRPAPDPQGDYVPMYLAHTFFQDKETWRILKKGLERFGRDAGLFDEISIRKLGSRGSEPFQVQVRKARKPGDRLKGPPRNLIDVGYGVSQVLPVITELLRPSSPPMFLLQQPEVHLHPSAQAGLGSLFCEVAAEGKQLIVETHSDHLMDRIRLDVRDSVSELEPEDVSILYFERDELDVHIHSLGIDGEGNVVGIDVEGNHTRPPEGYRQFFMEETRRALWV
ncbi:MAG: AAA family ATPase [Chloroflexi bacterium]|nr:AAA family ATPase [Chloroflexota bacterium]